MNLNRRLLDKIGTRAEPMPSLQVVQELVATSFYASMEREEGRDLAYAVAYIDHKELGVDGAVFPRDFDASSSCLASALSGAR
jgi:hypothetical protein